MKIKITGSDREEIKIGDVVDAIISPTGKTASFYDSDGRVWHLLGNFFEVLDRSYTVPDPGPIRTIAFECTTEVMKAQVNWPAFNSAHEGFAVLKEEVDELWDHVKMNQKKRDLEDMRKEAIQVAAMAMRFALEICDEGRGRK